MLDPRTIQSLARQLYDARHSRTQLRHFSRLHPQMTIDDAYAIQRDWVELELQDGRTIKGRKIGLTSRASPPTRASSSAGCACGLPKSTCAGLAPF